MLKLSNVSIRNYVLGMIFLGLTVVLLGFGQVFAPVITGVSSVILLGAELRKLL